MNFGAACCGALRILANKESNVFGLCDCGWKWFPYFSQDKMILSYYYNHLFIWNANSNILRQNSNNMIKPSHMEFPVYWSPNWFLQMFTTQQGSIPKSIHLFNRCSNFKMETWKVPQACEDQLRLVELQLLVLLLRCVCGGCQLAYLHQPCKTNANKMNWYFTTYFLATSQESPPTDQPGWTEEERHTTWAIKTLIPLRWSKEGNEGIRWR